MTPVLAPVLAVDPAAMAMLLLGSMAIGAALGAAIARLTH